MNNMNASEITLKHKSSLHVGPVNIFPNFWHWCIYIHNMNTNSVITHYDVIKWKHLPRYWPFVRRIHRSPVNYPYKGQWRGALVFSLICSWIHGWVNNREAGDLRRHRAQYNVIVMYTIRVLDSRHSILIMSLRSRRYFYGKYSLKWWYNLYQKLKNSPNNTWREFNHWNQQRFDDKLRCNHTLQWRHNESDH